MKGIYIIEFDIYPGIYKVGCSNNINKRFKQIKKDSILLGAARLVYSKEFKDYLRAEKEVHYLLNSYRVQQNREFFKTDLQIIKDTIDKINPEIFSEEYNRVVRNTTEIIFDWLVKNCYKPETEELVITTFDRHQLCNELHIGNNQITNSLKRLKDSERISGEKGSFKVIKI